MSMLQVKNVPAELHAALASRAKSQGLTMSDYVVRLLSQDLGRPTVEDWVAARQQISAGREVDVVRLVDDIRVDFDPPADAEDASEGGHGHATGRASGRRVSTPQAST